MIDRMMEKNIWGKKREGKNEEIKREEKKGKKIEWLSEEDENEVNEVDVKGKCEKVKEW